VKEISVQQYTFRPWSNQEGLLPVLEEISKMGYSGLEMCCFGGFEALGMPARELKKRLDDLIRRSLEVAAPAQPAHVQTITQLDCEGVTLSGNETQLSQLLLNLILNAFHAMEQSGGTLTLTTRSQEDRLCVVVADTGAGIPEDALPHIFEPFFTTKESGKGTGLGLAIVHQVVESHHGQIRVDSTVGQGTTFTLCFPLSNGES